MSGPSVGKHSKEPDWSSFQEHLAAMWRNSGRRQEEVVRVAGDQEEGWPMRSGGDTPLCPRTVKETHAQGTDPKLASVSTHKGG